MPQITCPDCKGEGAIDMPWPVGPKVVSVTCARCGGTGVITVEKKKP